MAIADPRLQAEAPTQVLPGLAYSTPEEAAAIQPAILDQLENNDELPTDPIVPASVVQHAYGMEPIPSEEEEEAPAEPQPVSLAKSARQK